MFTNFPCQHELLQTYQLQNNKPIMITDVPSLGYNIQGVPILGNILAATNAPVYVQTDARLVELYQRSYGNHKMVIRPYNNLIKFADGSNTPASEADIYTFYEHNNLQLARLSHHAKDYVWTSLLRPEVAHPFNTHLTLPEFISPPKPGYLKADKAEVKQWNRSGIFNENEIPVLINWNKTTSQHGNAQAQNFEAEEVAAFITKLRQSAPDLNFAFYNAMHGVGLEELEQVNRHLPEPTSHLKLIFDPAANETLFNLGQEIDRYAALMQSMKDNGGISVGSGNTYQHLWYAMESDMANSVNQFILLPSGSFPTKAAWQIQERQPLYATCCVEKNGHVENTATKLANRVLLAMALCR